MKFEDSEIGIDEIVKRIGRGNFRVKEAVEVPTPEDNTSGSDPVQ